ncbi:MAG: Uma2 family endonuclease [Nitrospira sp.]|nr:Uma2 family endonuclease [Nitrospira sp.]
MSVEPMKRLFTTAEYRRMMEVGILTEKDRVELIEGQIMEIGPMGDRQAACVDSLKTFLNLQLDQSAIVLAQNPIALDQHSELQPDLILLQPRADLYAQIHPTPADIRLVIEITGAFGEYDRSVKLPLYARAAILEVWLVDLFKDLIEVYREPSEGVYQKVQQVQRGQALSPKEFPDLELSADTVLG